MNRQKFVILIMICCIFLTGCWDHNEPERLLILNGIGVDYKDGEVVVYLQIINLQGLAKQEGGGGATSITPAEIGRSSGKTFEEAVFKLYHSIDRRIFWGHLSFVILSEAAVKKGAVKDMADFIDRFRETRYRIYFFVTKDSIKKAMLVSPLDNIPLAFSKLSDPRDNYKQTSFIEPINLRELIIQLDEPGHQVHLPVLKITEHWATKDKKKTDFLIEEVAIVSENTLLGILPKHIVKGTRFLNKGFIRDIVVIPLNPTINFSVIVYDKKTKIIPMVEQDGKVRFNIKIKLKASLQMSKLTQSTQKYEKELKDVISKNVHKTYNYTYKRGMDVLDFSETLYKKDVKQWKRVQKNGRVPLEKDTLKSVIVDVKLQNTGRNRMTPLFNEQYNKGLKIRQEEEKQ